MSSKFNFLDRRTKPAKIAADLRRRFPNRPAAWADSMAASLTDASQDVSRELRDPQPFATTKQKGRQHG